MAIKRDLPKTGKLDSAQPGSNPGEKATDGIIRLVLTTNRSATASEP